MQESKKELSGIWNNKNQELPDANGKYLVLIDCDGKKEITISSFIKRKKEFHFDMHHIKWKVLKWMELPKY